MKQHLIFLLLLLLSQNIIAQKHTFQAPKMGTLIQVTIADQDSLTAFNAAQEVFHLYDTLNQILSDYLPDSELNQLCKKAGTGEWMQVSPHLLHILQLSQVAYKQSNGAFDPSMGSLVQLWRTTRKTKKFPDKKSLVEALQTKGFQLGKNIEIIENQVRLNRKKVQLDFGGIAKGYAAQCAVDRLKESGINNVLIDSGGDLTVGDTPKNTQGWKIAINHPNDAGEPLPYYLEVVNCSIATSGSLYQSVEINKKHYSHIINPTTGIGLTHQKNVTILAKDGATADWLATACSVLSIKKAKRLIYKVNKNIKTPESPSRLFITYWYRGKIKTEKIGDFKWISLN